MNNFVAMTGSQQVSMTIAKIERHALAIAPYQRKRDQGLLSSQELEFLVIAEEGIGDMLTGIMKWISDAIHNFKYRVSKFLRGGDDDKLWKDVVNNKISMVSNFDASTFNNEKWGNFATSCCNKTELQKILKSVTAYMGIYLKLENIRKADPKIDFKKIPDVAPLMKEFENIGLFFDFNTGKIDTSDFKLKFKTDKSVSIKSQGFVFADIIPLLKLCKDNVAAVDKVYAFSNQFGTIRAQLSAACHTITNDPGLSKEQREDKKKLLIIELQRVHAVFYTGDCAMWAGDRATDEFIVEVVEPMEDIATLR